MLQVRVRRLRQLPPARAPVESDLPDARRQPPAHRKGESPRPSPRRFVPPTASAGSGAPRRVRCRCSPKAEVATQFRNNRAAPKHRSHYAPTAKRRFRRCHRRSVTHSGRPRAVRRPRASEQPHPRRITWRQVTFPSRRRSPRQRAGPDLPGTGIPRPPRGLIAPANSRLRRLHRRQEARTPVSSLPRVRPTAHPRATRSLDPSRKPARARRPPRRAPPHNLRKQSRFRSRPQRRSANAQSPDTPLLAARLARRRKARPLHPDAALARFAPMHALRTQRKPLCRRRRHPYPHAPRARRRRAKES
jgi:hypothetical protein